MGIYDGPGIYSSVLGQPQDLKHYKTHPALEAQLLDPANDIWGRGNLFLRLFPEQMYPCLGARLVQAHDSTATLAERRQAKSELEGLRKCIARYFRRSTRPAGRPPKLTPRERQGMAAEHEALMQLIRRLSGQDQTEPERLNGLFSDPTFLREIFREFPQKRGDDPTGWTQFLKDTAFMSASERSLRYLGRRYGVSGHTIHHAIWDKPGRP
jgi:hypothetical protein